MYSGYVRAKSIPSSICLQTLSKYELLQLFKENFRIDLSVKPNVNQKHTVSRGLETKYSTIKEIFGHNFPMKQAIRELAIEMEDQ